MLKSTVAAASLALAAFFTSTAMADPLISLGGLSVGNSSTVGNPVGLPDVISQVTSTVGGVTGGSVGVPGVAEVTVNGSNPLNTTVTLGGGGGESINGGVGGILGQSGVNLAINLPSGLPGVPGLPELPGGGNGTNGGNGGNGANGANGANGTGGGNLNLTILLGNNGNNGANGANGVNSNNSGIQFAANGGSSRLRMLMKILEDRDWLKLVAGNAVCLQGFGTASISGWLKPQDMAQLKAVVTYYKRDIAMLQKLLTNCRGNRTTIGRNDAKRVIGLDIKNGQPVLFML